MPVLGRWRQNYPWVHWPAGLAYLERPSSQCKNLPQNNRLAPKEWYPRLTSGLHMHIYIYSHTYQQNGSHLLSDEWSFHNSFSHNLSLKSEKQTAVKNGGKFPSSTTYRWKPNFSNYQGINLNIFLISLGEGKYCSDSKSHRQKITEKRTLL